MGLKFKSVPIIFIGFLLAIGENILFLPEAIGKSTPSRKKVTRVVRGNCGKKGCTTLLRELRSRYPQLVSEYEKECSLPSILSIQIITTDNKNRHAFLSCWDAKKERDGTRSGSILGSLPLVGQEAGFLTPLPTSPYTQQLQIKYPSEVKKAQFTCATYGGNFNILESEDKNSVELQCYFQAGVSLVDENNDFLSDGENSRGAGVDIILGKFPVEPN